MKTKTILIGIIDQFAEFESAYLTSAVYMLGQGNFEVKTVSITKEPVRSVGGMNVLPDYSIETAPRDCEALVLIGGMCWRGEEAQKMKTIVNDYHTQGKLVAGICDASGFLGTMGLLNEVDHTSNDINDLKMWAKDAYTGEKRYITRQAVRGEGIITANGTATLEFAKEILLALEVASKERILEWYQFHKLGYYCVALPKM